MAALETLQDDFSGPSRDSAKWNLGGFRVTPSGTMVPVQSGGVVTIPVGTTAGEYNGYGSVDTFDATGSHAFVRLVDSGVLVGPHIPSFYVYADGSNSWGFELSSGSGGGPLNFVNWVAGADNYLSSVTYDPDVHAWLRLRHDEDVGEEVDDLVWEAAPIEAADPPAPGDWVELYRTARTITITTVRVSFTDGAYASSGDVMGTIWDGFNTATAPGTSGVSIPVVMHHLQQQGIS